MPSVRLDSMLREFVPRLELESGAKDVGGLISELESRFPRVRFRLRDETGELRRFVRVFVNGEDVPAARALATPLGPNDKVDILHSIQGG